MRRIFGLIFVISLLGMTACKTGGGRTVASAQAETETPDLTWDEARSRKARLSDVAYEVEVNLVANGPTYEGKSRIRFTLKDAARPLRLDFFEGDVRSLKVNGDAVDPTVAKRKYSIELPVTALKEGENLVEIDFAQSYSRQGTGLHKFTDPQTKEVFLHTQFETYYANRFMPCFDQPDLRAPLTLTVEAPKSWTVVTATRESKVTTKGAVKRWSFPATPKISTYLYSLHAGPFKVWTDRYEDIPLRLFARPSMAKHVRVKEWFKYTKQGLKFFNSYFDFKYPFKKYDQLAVPEFNSGAMENVAAVTFSENFLWRSQPTRDQLRGLASVILHEMAHMWFGDIVTMKWWNDLWLNESFATFMATLALAEGTEFKEAWQAFFASEKQWAYWEDSLVTTHPIEGDVKTVRMAMASFDGITYGKGAAVLKQLNAYISPEAFRDGIRHYIKTYAYQNAELKEFIGALQTRSDKDLNAWASLWLRQSGTDKIAAKWACEGDKLSAVELIVTPTPGRKFRPQTMELALLKDAKSKPLKVTRVTLTEPRTRVAVDTACPAFVYPNYGDYGFVAVSLDPRSLEFARENLSSVSDTLLRTMIWDDLWEMVRNTEMPLKDYVAIVKRHFPKETDPILANEIVSTISGRWSEDTTIIRYWPETEERLQRERMEFIAEMEKEYLRRFKAAKAGSDDQRRWFDNYVSLSRSKEALDQLAKWAGLPQVAKGMPLDLDRQWRIVNRLTRYQHPQAQTLLAAMRIKDTSDRGVRSALAAEAAQPDPQIKEKWVSILSQPKPQVSFAEARFVASSLFPSEQVSLAKRFEKEFYEYLKVHGASEHDLFVQVVASGLSPLTCSNESSTRFRKFISDESKFSPSVAKALKVDLDEDERCQRIRAMSSL